MSRQFLRAGVARPPAASASGHGIHRHPRHRNRLPPQGRSPCPQSTPLQPAVSAHGGPVPPRSETARILVYSVFFLPEQHASHIELLRQKADDGASIRILLGDPDSPQVALKGQEEDIGDAIAAKIRNVLLAYYMPFASHPGITIKLHATTLYNSIFWFDDDMLVNTHVYGVPAHFAPVLHLRHLSSGTLFQTYARSFDRVWDQTRKTWTGQKGL
jgi:hypothetical protein